MTTPISDLEAREAFHALLLAHLPESYRAPGGGQQAPLRLKGGVNLRLFHRSERFSEDMDFDLTPDRGPQFLTHLRKLLLESPPLRRALLRAGIEDLTVSVLDGGGPGSAGFKQKVQLICGGVPLPTKIEGSYREETLPAEAIAQPIPAPFVTRYRLEPAPMVATYPAPVAMWQKALALSRRDPPQTRDIYDLDHLTTSYSLDVAAAGRQLTLERMNVGALRQAAETVAAFTRQEFEGQVIAFLPDTRRNDILAGWASLQERGWLWFEGLIEERTKRDGHDETPEG